MWEDNMKTKKKAAIKSLTHPEVKTQDNNLTLKKIREIAKSKGINPGKMKKAELIKSIQRAEGNFDCFGTATAGYCDQQNCLWMTACINRR
jgi:hypothetical protein